MRLPTRPGPYILTLLLFVLIALVAWLFQALTSPVLTHALQKQATEKNTKLSPSSTRLIPPPPPVFIDPANQTRANQLHALDHSPVQDLEIVRDFLALYRRAYGSNPTGSNEDITAALTGSGGQSGRVFPPNSPAIRAGQLTDRWGTPYWFHAESGTQMEIRSAGPDKNLFTTDDIILPP